MLEVMNNTRIRIRPTNYAFTLIADRMADTDETAGELELCIKVQSSNYMRLVELIVLLDHNTGNRNFDKFRIPVELPITVTYTEDADGPAQSVATELSARLFWLEQDGKDVTIFVDGYTKAIRLSAADFDMKLRELFVRVGHPNRCLQFSSTDLKATPVAENGLQRQFNVFAMDYAASNAGGQRQTITLCWRDDVAVLATHSRIGVNPRPATNCDFPTYLNQQYTRVNRLPMKVFTRDGDGFWVLEQPAANANIARIVTDSYEFTWL